MRCSTSGRFTPAAATFTTISFGLGAGFGRSTTRSTSGPPGLLISTARIVVAIIPTRRSAGGPISRRVRAGPGERQISRRALQPRAPRGADRAHGGALSVAGSGGPGARAALQGCDPAVPEARPAARARRRQEAQAAQTGESQEGKEKGGQAAQAPLRHTS